MSNEEMEQLKLLWEEFKYKHDHFWKLFFRLGFAILFLLMVPYAYTEKIRQFGMYVLMIPVLSLLLSLSSAWLFWAEYLRLKKVIDKYKEKMIPEYVPYELTKEDMGIVFSLRIGEFVTILFGGFFSLASFVEFLTLCFTL